MNPGTVLIAVLFGALVASSAQADTATQPTSNIASLQWAVSATTDRASIAKNKAAEAEAGCLKRLEKSAEYKSLQADADAKEKFLNEARRSGSPDQKLDASRAFVKARKAVQEMRASTVESDPIVKENRDEYAAAENELKSATAALSLEVTRANQEQKAKDALAEEQRMKDPIYRAMKDGTLAIGMTEDQAEKAMAVRGYKGVTTFTGVSFKIVDYGLLFPAADGTHPMIAKYTVSYRDGRIAGIDVHADPLSGGEGRPVDPTRGFR